MYKTKTFEATGLIRLDELINEWFKAQNGMIRPISESFFIRTSSGTNTYFKSYTFEVLE